MKDTLQERMQDALRLTLAGRLDEATAAIQQALKHAEAQTPPQDSAEQAADRASVRTWDDEVIDVEARVVDIACADELPTPVVATASALTDREVAADPDDAAEASEAGAPAGNGEFIGGNHSHGSLSRRYKLFVPPDHARLGHRPPALVVMLHGCTQNPDDFALGTGMNERAREQGFFVLYPEQSKAANPQQCWNWFKHNHQQRGSGEPALIASLTLAVIEQRGIDPDRVYIAGLSAGGAMAAVVAAAYPDIFAAAGVHSGLPGGAASDVAGALAMMSTGSVPPRRPGRAGAPGAAALAPMRSSSSSTPPPPSVPTIVFHGDQDRTVHPRNGEQLIAAALGSATAAAAAGNGSGSTPGGGAQVERGVAARGRHYTRSVHRSGNGDAVAEHWLVHGSGHAWSGGNAKGSFVDSEGPDASAEMLRFFFARSRQRRPG